MFASWGRLVVRGRFTVIGIMVAGMLAMAVYGLSLQDHLSQSGWDDPGSESVAAAKLADGTFGRDTQGDVIAMYRAPEGSTVEDPAWQAEVSASLTRIVEENPDRILQANGGFFEVGDAPQFPQFASPDGRWGIESIAIAGDNDTEITQNFRDVKDEFYADGLDVQLAGLQPVAGALNDTMAEDIKRMEILAIPAVGVLLFFVFGGVVAAALPLVIGGLTVIAANGIVRLFAEFTEVNSFVVPVVSLIGLGLAIDYGLFIVSRFREELADGYEVDAAVRRTVMTAGRTVVFSATMIVASLGGLLIFPQGFLKSVAYGAIATVTLAAIASITILPALLAIIGRRVDALTFERLRQNKTSEEIEAGFWGRTTAWVMRNPLKVTIPIVIGLLLLITPLTGIRFGGINETYLPPGSDTRVAQETFDEQFPGMRTEPVKLVVTDASNQELGQILRDASEAPGLVERFSPEGAAQDGVVVLKAGLENRNDSDSTIEYLRSIDVPDGVQVLVGGTPAIEYDSIQALLDNLPLMILIVVGLTTVLMFLTFGSLVLPIKAALMSALGLGATLGILTWIFVDGHGADALNFTPGPIMSPVLVLIIAIIYGLSTDYEVFLVSRMVEARAKGASTAEAVRVGTAHTGRIITAAALILIVVTGAFAFSELVMMKYIAYGMIAALLIDATIIRMGLVPAVMKMLGDDCWWAPRWMQRIQERIGLAEPILDDELSSKDIPQLTPVAAPPGPNAAATPTATARRPADPLTEPIPLASGSAAAPDERVSREATEARRSATGRPSRAPGDGDPQGGGRPTTPPARPSGPATESRPIESWLADLRSTSPGPHTSPGEPRRAQPAGGSSAPRNGTPSGGTQGNGTPSNGVPSTTSQSSGTRSSGAGRSGAGSESTRANGSANGGSGSTGAPSSGGRRSAPDPDDVAGRHHADDPNALSVSELLARQKRRDR